ncbi:MAG: hypothetical protein GX043_06120 [Desulfovibrionales bacterium]|nr:hypothetical protein [Desulfovibrionales bacterium]
MANKYLARVAGRTQQVEAVTTGGPGSAGKLLAYGEDGRIHITALPPGIGVDANIFVASEALSAGDFVNIHDDSGTAKCRKADNSNGREADGFVTEAVSSSGEATVYPLDGTNNEMTGLSPGKKYWLGVSGAVISEPLNPTTNPNKICQYLGKAAWFTRLLSL